MPPMSATVRRCFVVLLVACGGASVPDIPSGPSNGSPTASTGTCAGTQCDCHEKPSCSIDCGSVQGCQADCHQNQASCDVACRNDCHPDCHQSGACHVTCGDRCNLDCHQTSGSCTAKVGINSTVDCHESGDCQIQCVDACAVDCRDSKTCRVVCSGFVQTCNVQCTGGATPMVCPDGKTKVCPGTTC
jgi:hypothetical protein